MSIFEALHIAWRALVVNKMRTALTMLGMVIGVGAVIGLMSVGQGSQAQIVNRINSLGTNLLLVTPGATEQGGIRAAAGSAASLTMEDVAAIADPANAPSVARVSPESGSFGQVVANGNNVNTRITGASPDYPDVHSFHVASGDFFTTDQMNARAAVAVLGADTATQLFGTSDPIGQTVRINRLSFQVIGVMESKGAQAFGNQDDIVFVPITTLQARIGARRSADGSLSVSTIAVSAVNAERMEAASAEITALLTTRHGAQDFTVQNQKDIASALTAVTGTLTLLLGFIAGISLLVGGIGIMNIMLVSVTERTREIGIRKAVGATRRDIFTQFLVESALVSAAGGGVGVALGLIIARALHGVSINGQEMNPVVTLFPVVLALSVALAIGLFFGSYPAVRASRLRPIEALRSE